MAGRAMTRARVRGAGGEGKDGNWNWSDRSTVFNMDLPSQPRFEVQLWPFPLDQPRSWAHRAYTHSTWHCLWWVYSAVQPQLNALGIQGKESEPSKPGMTLAP